MGLASKVVGAAVASAVEAEKSARKRDPVRWLITRGIIAVVLLVGWAFIVWQNKFHVTAPTFFVCVGYLAVVMTVVNLWRTGAAAMSTDEPTGVAWSQPIGERGELEKEKKTLLKAIKEAEFDHQMGKLSKADADAMIQTYRARAIEVIKELERFDSVDMQVDPAGRPLGQLSVREQIAREVKARLELAAKSKKKKPDKAEAKKADEAEAKKADDGKAAAKAEEPKAEEPKAEEPNVEAQPAAKDDKPEASEATS